MRRKSDSVHRGRRNMLRVSTSCSLICPPKKQIVGREILKAMIHNQKLNKVVLVSEGPTHH